ncbi:MAG: VWA domain-containing protein, partial [Clostridia bacterium]|nr:VWA domain-containing protein [Clostridia bacterium]
MFRVMSKKIIWVLVFAIFSLICFFPVEGYANQDILKLGGISLDMPEVSVEIRGDVTSENISAALGGKTLVVDSAERYDSKIHSVRTYILVDVSSGTTPREYLDRVKVFVKSYAENMGANDKIILLSMGESTHEAASVSGADDKNSFYEKVDSLVCDEPHTQVYDAIYTAFEMAEQDANVSFDRDIILAFTDFVNDMTDGNGVALPGKSMNSLLSDFDISTMPVYATYRGLDADELSAAGESVDKSNGQFFEIGYFFDNIEICMDIVNDVSIIKMHAEDEADFANSQV